MERSSQRDGNWGSEHVSERVSDKEKNLKLTQETLPSPRRTVWKSWQVGKVVWGSILILSKCPVGVEEEKEDWEDPPNQVMSQNDNFPKLKRCFRWKSRMSQQIWWRGPETAAIEVKRNNQAKKEVWLRRQGRLSGKKERNPGNNRQPKPVRPRNITQKKGIYRNDNKVKVKI